MELFCKSNCLASLYRNPALVLVLAQLARLVVDHLPLHLFATWAESVRTLCPVLDPAPEVVHPSGDAGRGQGLCRPAVLELAALPDVGCTALVPAVDVVDSTGAMTAADIEEDAAGTATDTAHPDVVEEGASQNLAHAPHLDAPVVGLPATNVVAGGHRAEAVPAAVLQVAVGLVVDRTPGHDLAPTLGDRILPIPEDALPEVGVAQGVEAHLLERGFVLAAEVPAAQRTPLCRLVPVLAVVINVVVAVLDSRLHETPSAVFFLDSKGKKTRAHVIARRWYAKKPRLYSRYISSFSHASI